MGTIARVRHAFYVQGWSVKRIVRDLHVSRREARAATGSRPRRTVRKFLRSDETGFSQERERQPMPRIGPWQEKLDELLLGNANKPSRERLTQIRIYEELRAMVNRHGKRDRLPAAEVLDQSMDRTLDWWDRAWLRHPISAERFLVEARSSLPLLEARVRTH